MRIANLGGRSSLIVGGDRYLDLERATRGRVPAQPDALWAGWPEFRLELLELAADAEASDPFDPDLLGPPVPRPAQVFAVGLNYRDHLTESGLDPTGLPAVFTKFPSSLCGPGARVALPRGGLTDWEAELVLVIGDVVGRAAQETGWSCVAGVTVGQDLSERITQFDAGGQFCLGKSYPGFSPIGPWVVTVDELDNPDDLELGCRLADEVLQCARTSEMIWSVPAMLEALSSVVTLYPGDLVFTGTPGGIGATRTPARFLSGGDVLTTWVEGVGELTVTLVDPS